MHADKEEHRSVEEILRGALRRENAAAGNLADAALLSVSELRAQLRELGALPGGKSQKKVNPRYT